MDIQYYCHYEYDSYDTPRGDGFNLSHIIHESLKIHYLYFSILEKFDLIHNNSIISRYCFEKLFGENGLVSFDSYEFNILTQNGYYGDELDAIELDTSSSLYRKLEEFSNMSETEQIRYVLQEEYGYILPELYYIHNINVQNIDPSTITLTNKNLSYQKTKKVEKLFKSYILGEESLIFGILLHMDNKYRLIDGNHRTAYAQKMHTNRQYIILDCPAIPNMEF